MLTPLLRTAIGQPPLTDKKTNKQWDDRNGEATFSVLQRKWDGSLDPRTITFNQFECIVMKGYLCLAFLFFFFLTRLSLTRTNDSVAT